MQVFLWNCGAFFWPDFGRISGWNLIKFFVIFRPNWHTILPLLLLALTADYWTVSWVVSLRFFMEKRFNFSGSNSCQKITRLQKLVKTFCPQKKNARFFFFCGKWQFSEEKLMEHKFVRWFSISILYTQSVNKHRNLTHLLSYLCVVHGPWFLRSIYIVTTSFFSAKVEPSTYNIIVTSWVIPCTPQLDGTKAILGNMIFSLSWELDFIPEWRERKFWRKHNIKQISLLNYCPLTLVVQNICIMQTMGLIFSPFFFFTITIMGASFLWTKLCHSLFNTNYYWCQ